MVYYATLAVIVVVTVTGWGLFAWQTGSTAVSVVVGSLLLAVFAEIAFDIYRRHGGGARDATDWQDQLSPGGVVRFTGEGGFYLEHPGSTSRPDRRRAVTPPGDDSR